ncbi:hypothetical protein HBH70_121860 [Parastagonospora nodorum]|uniref:Aminoglycoside phosphotransferase domain-containing protein n=1 Tax=Phaeosphaeria nodorum (strain SN15 / ATCC MYA-4574 / FGSC 10173) TaxID=321614 RepID=A0A7U2F3M9_PHANO|nr:hypothetical protein HBH51_144800 [Parastagonospora nodorum]QRC98087.1 hypothetical protein JI435_041980 [Parastagonospora nodorum SN15]KAH3989532.1 hypothetical protein HBH52_019790 [Parastagonospora nodorum]KAH3998408.1 hypothetical protein HBI10_132660 [Parastagonospora nodorum]KAH4057436.1 hypothetical protein HBH49_046250 [Parastagonospora nodorum]
MSCTVSVDDSDAASCASSERSTTSTEEFEHEPFSAFKTQVTQLCEDVWPHLSPGAFEVTHMEGGSYNCVIGVQGDMSHKRISWLQRHATGLLQIFWPRSANRQKEIQEYVIRIPRYEHAWVEQEIALLFFLAATNVPAPKIEHFSLTLDNVIESPFPIQAQIPGRLFGEVYSTLNTTQRIAFAEDLGRALRELSLFNADNDYYLTHMDFEPRNILLHSISNDIASLSGILDWDESVFAPAFLSCRAPSWRWDFEGDDDEELDESIAHVDPQDVELLAIKQAFESAVDAKWLVYAYKTEYRLAREIIRLAITGINSSEGYDVANRIVKEWNELRPAQAVHKIVPGDED